MVTESRGLNGGPRRHEAKGQGPISVTLTVSPGDHGTGQGPVTQGVRHQQATGQGPSPGESGGLNGTGQGPNKHEATGQGPISVTTGW